jgi:hypothetical protein
MTAKYRSITPKRTALHEFDIRDARGRVIGCTVTTWEREWSISHYTHEGKQPPGISYCFKPQTTRNGQPFGQGSGVHECSTSALREAAIAAWLRKARERAIAISPSP